MSKKKSGQDQDRLLTAGELMRLEAAHRLGKEERRKVDEDMRQRYRVLFEPLMEEVLRDTPPSQVGVAREALKAFVAKAEEELCGEEER